MILFYRICCYEGYQAYINMIDYHQFLQAKRPAMVHQEHRVVLQKWHNDVLCQGSVGLSLKRDSTLCPSRLIVISIELKGNLLGKTFQKEPCLEEKTFQGR